MDNSLSSTPDVGSSFSIDGANVGKGSSWLTIGSVWPAGSDLFEYRTI
jgi:hypothetical protein